MEDALDRLDRLTQEEARMAAAQGLKATHEVDNKVRAIDDKVDLIIDGVQPEFILSLARHSILSD